MGPRAGRKGAAGAYGATVLSTELGDGRMRTIAAEVQTLGLTQRRSLDINLALQLPSLQAAPWAHSSAVQSRRLITGKTLVRIQVGPFLMDVRPERDGRIAQLAEHLDHNQRVGGSSPSSPTIPFLPGAV